MPDPHPAAGGSLPHSTLVLGGARSGKSSYAQALLGEGPAVYVATGQPRDAEMAERIAQHRRDRPAGWHTLEEPLDLASALPRAAAEGGAVLIDCLTLWLSNLLEAGRDPHLETGRLLAAMETIPAPVVLVSNELGLGLVPENAAARAFRDAHGRMNQAVAAACRRVVFVAAGLPLILKDERE